MKITHRFAAGALAALMAASLAGCAADDGTVDLTFQIWDVAQRDGMQAMCDAYTAQHPDVHIEVQVINWDEYWTKLEAATMSNKMPDIFWMHTNEILKYADNGKLADCSDIVETEHFSDISLSNASGSDGVLYGLTRTRPGPGTTLWKPLKKSTMLPATTATWPMPTTSLATGILCIRRAAAS